MGHCGRTERNGQHDCRLLTALRGAAHQYRRSSDRLSEVAAPGVACTHVEGYISGRGLVELTIAVAPRFGQRRSVAWSLPSLPLCSERRSWACRQRWAPCSAAVRCWVTPVSSFIKRRIDVDDCIALLGQAGVEIMGCGVLCRARSRLLPICNASRLNVNHYLLRACA